MTATTGTTATTSIRRASAHPTTAAMRRALAGDAPNGSPATASVPMVVQQEAEATVGYFSTAPADTLVRIRLTSADGYAVQLHFAVPDAGAARLVDRTCPLPAASLIYPGGSVSRTPWDRVPASQGSGHVNRPRTRALVDELIQARRVDTALRCAEATPQTQRPAFVWEVRDGCDKTIRPGERIRVPAGSADAPPTVGRIARIRQVDLSTRRIGKFTALKVDIVTDDGGHADRVLVGHRMEHQ